MVVPLSEEMERQRIENMSDMVDYFLANEAYRSLPGILKERLGIQIEGRLLRRYVRIGKTERQVNIWGYGHRNRQRVLIVGEVKIRPSRREVDEFLHMVRELEIQEGLPVASVIVAHDFPPPVEKYIQEKGILPVWSYDL